MIFSRDWFIKHQRILLWFVNTWIGRKILCIDGKKSSVGKSKIIHIEPNAIWWRSGKKITAEFRTHDKFGKRLYYAFKPLWYLIHFWDTLFANNWQPQWNLGFDSLTRYPVAGANSPVDGIVERIRTAGVDAEIFGTIRAGAGTTATVTGASDEIVLLQASNNGADTDKYVTLTRGIFCFDTSSLSAGATGVTGVISFFGQTKYNALGSPVFHVSGATPAATNNLVAADYGQLQTTSFGTVAYAAWSEIAYNDIDMNANGDSNISLTGVSKFGTQTSWDILNDATGLTWVNNGVSGFTVYLADQDGTANDPKLVVTYTPAASGVSGYKSLLGVGQA